MNFAVDIYGPPKTNLNVFWWPFWPLVSTQNTSEATVWAYGHSSYCSYTRTWGCKRLLIESYRDDMIILCHCLRNIFTCWWSLTLTTLKSKLKDSVLLWLDLFPELNMDLLLHWNCISCLLFSIYLCFILLHFVPF